MPSIKLPTIHRIDLTKIQVPQVNLPSFPLPQIPTDKVVQTAKDLAYTTVGFGVLAFQKSQVRRRELTDMIQAQVPRVTEQAIAQAESAVSQVMTLVNARRSKTTQPTEAKDTSSTK
jgi:uncharacterized protein YegL